MDSKLAFSSVGLFLLGIGAGVVVLDRHALRDASALVRKPYSLARVQLWWWTVLVLASEILTYGMSEPSWQFNATCLTLLGISAATTAAARLIDKSDILRGASRHQDAESHGGFLVDLLSNERGLSLHRLQSVAFHFSYGVAFVVEVLSGNAGELDTKTLVLLGLSSGTYLTLKALENAATPGAALTTHPAKREALIDAGDHAGGSAAQPRARMAGTRDTGEHAT